MLAAAGELDVVIVNPGFLLGPLDAKPSSGRLILRVAKSRVLVLPGGVNNFVDVRDVAAGMIAAFERGRPGERYILGGENMTYREIVTTIAHVLGRAPPRLTVPYTVARMVGWVGDAVELASDRAIDVNTAIVRYGYCRAFHFSSDKAERELGYRPRPVAQAIEDAVAWFRQAGMLA
jgi:dihydroflavonol-4-reductase